MFGHKIYLYLIIADYEMKSKHYVFLCFFLVSASLAVKTSKLNLLADRKYCGYQHTDDYVRSSNNISIDEFPWMAQLLYDEERMIRCTGSLINNRYVLTTAHCLKPQNNDLVAVQLGDYNVKTETDCVKNYHHDTECSDPVQLFNVEEKIVHPSVNFKKSDNDIGLIRLSRTVQFSDYVRPICLPDKNSPELIDGQIMVTSGWGTLGYHLDVTELKKQL
ncbi:hypothetical protein RN001_003983 [Aquatica leii]|uniref:Peptidase S1 domain-containing protein n=1 Tax=Aquatica leii TaxID=1421715 RepID=A0AAN7PJ40_9COLE|nr:hypothetical protein RN001_003983 [Aquatica leii]